MQKHRYLALAFVSVAASWLGCDTGATPNGTGGTGETDASQNGGGPPATGGGGPASTSNPTGTPAGHVDGGAANGDGGTSATVGTDAGGLAPDASEGGTTQPTAAIPPPATAPYLWGAGVGITDVPSAVKFYTGVMQMTVEQSDVQRDDRTETVLVASQGKRGSRLVLMNFNDKRNTQKITAKLVWQASNPMGVSTAAASYPGYVSRLAGALVQFDGPETYIQEVGSTFDTGGTGITVPYLIALGMSVSDQTASRKFYTTAFGMTTEALTGTFPITDATGSATVTEYTEQFSTQMGAAIVLQAWTPMRNSKNNPVKIVLFVPDAQAAADKVVAAGGTSVKPAERTPVYDNRKLVVAADLDGYILELVE